MGLVRRRHFATRGRTLLGIEDELFGEGAAMLDESDSGGNGQVAAGPPDRRPRGVARTGRLSDIVATIQGEQDEIIRSELPGVLVVQGGPGTGKTVVALHRAAYLLYTYRFPLEGQGVLVVGPNRLFLGYIEQVLPSLGRGRRRAGGAGRPGRERAGRGRDALPRPGSRAIRAWHGCWPRRCATASGRCARPLRVPYGVQTLVVAPEARPRSWPRPGAASGCTTPAPLRRVAAVRGAVRGQPPAHHPRRGARAAPASPEVREALERMWPVLTPAELLHDLYGSRALVDLAAGRLLTDDERAALARPRADDVERVVDPRRRPTARRGPSPCSAPARRRRSNNGAGDPDEVRTYGHIVVDEAQDLSPMQLRMLERRSLNGSMTVVGDIAQATGVWAHRNWDEILEHLPSAVPASGPS